MIIASENSAQLLLRYVGALVVLVAALTSLVYSVAAGELSFLAIYLACLIGGSAIAVVTAGSEHDQRRVVAVFLVVYSGNVLITIQ